MGVTLQTPNDPLAIIEEEACAVGASLWVAAGSLMEQLIFRLDGTHLNLPRRIAKKRQRIPREIVQRFSGGNVFELHGSTA